MSSDGETAWPVRLDMVIRVRCGQPPVHSRPGCWLARWVGLGSTSAHTLPNQTRRHVFCQVAASNSTALRSRVRRCVVQACARRMPRRVLQTHVAAMVRRRPSGHGASSAAHGLDAPEPPLWAICGCLASISHAAPIWRFCAPIGPEATPCTRPSSPVQAMATPAVFADAGWCRRP